MKRCVQKNVTFFCIDILTHKSYPKQLRQWNKEEAISDITGIRKELLPYHLRRNLGRGLG